jgi:hypothetical protein
MDVEDLTKYSFNVDIQVVFDLDTRDGEWDCG